LGAGSAGEAAGGDQARVRSAEVLADRLAAELARHEPGWRLPRHTALARRYNVSTAQIEAVISLLVGRRLVRRLANGHLYRVSPVEYLIPLEGVPGLHSRIDPMGADLTCQSRQTSWRRAPEGIGWALHVDPAEPVCVVRTAWAASGEPAAYATTYLPADMAGAFLGAGLPGVDEADDPPAEVASPGVALARSMAGPPGSAADAAAALSLLPLASSPEVPEALWSDLAVAGEPTALLVEVQVPAPPIARRLRLSAGQPATMVTIRFDDPATGRPAGLTVAVLRPELFRIMVQTAEVPRQDGGQGSSPGTCAGAGEGWES
jgi:hypothetical protein